MPVKVVSQLVGGKGMEGLRKAAEAPFGGERGLKVLKQVVYPAFKDQAAAGVGWRYGRMVLWPVTQPFGSSPAPSQTLHRTGDYVSAWTGGAGSKVEIKENTIRVGVSSKQFPQVYVFQNDEDTRSPKTGPVGIKQYNYLGWKFGVWLSPEKREQGLINRPRPFGISPDMVEDVRQLTIELMTKANKLFKSKAAK